MRVFRLATPPPAPHTPAANPCIGSAVTSTPAGVFLLILCQIRFTAFTVNWALIFMLARLNLTFLWLHLAHMKCRHRQRTTAEAFKTALLKVPVVAELFRLSSSVKDSCFHNNNKLLAQYICSGMNTGTASMCRPKQQPNSGGVVPTNQGQKLWVTRFECWWACQSSVGLMDTPSCIVSVCTFSSCSHTNLSHTHFVWFTYSNVKTNPLNLQREISELSHIIEACCSPCMSFFPCSRHILGHPLWDKKPDQTHYLNQTWAKQPWSHTASFHSALN